MIDGVHVIKKRLAISANLGIDHINPMIFFKSLLIMVFNNLKKGTILTNLFKFNNFANQNLTTYVKKFVKVQKTNWWSNMIITSFGFFTPWPILFTSSIDFMFKDLSTFENNSRLYSFVIINLSLANYKI